MPKSYSKFTYDDIKQLGIRVEEKSIFSNNMPPSVQPSNYLLETLKRNQRRKLKTEKAKSEFIIAPILGEIEEANADIAFYSGYNFDVDKERGLVGFCDYLFTYEPLSPVIEAPVFCVVEAKNDNLETGIPQCIAEMFAAQMFNQKNNQPLKTVYGATTFGLQWRFHRLDKNIATSDTDTYYLNTLPQLLGILQFIVKDGKN
jgi:hypothetical protein